MNILAYIIYLIISFFITIVIGNQFYKNGEIYLLFLIKDKENTKFINRLLLNGYYLVNLGFISYSISFWKNIKTPTELFEILVTNLGITILVLGLLHFNNLFIIYKFSNKKIKHQPLN